MQLTVPAIRILGLDPGSRITGYGVIALEGRQTSFVSCGVIKANVKLSLPQRIKEMHDGVVEVIRKHGPAIAVVEDVFVSVNPQSALKLGHARGAIILAAMLHGLKVFEYSPRLIKQAVVGYGQAGKLQVQHMVKVLLHLASNPSEDASDALAAALCHVNRGSADQLS